MRKSLVQCGNIVLDLRILEEVILLLSVTNHAYKFLKFLIL